MLEAVLEHLFGVNRIFLLFSFQFVPLQIAYRIARDQFNGRLQELFLVLSDDEPQPVNIEARRLSLDHPRDPRPSGSSREVGHKHRRDPDSMSVDSATNPKKPDQSRSTEKRK